MKSFMPLLFALFMTIVSSQPTRTYTPSAYGKSCGFHHPHNPHNNGSNSTASPWWKQGACDLSHVQMPTAPTSLPPPTGKLSQVALGRGTQNYTCDLTNSTAVPVPVGALASLFNISCIASKYQGWLPTLAEMALDAPNPSFLDMGGSFGHAAVGLLNIESTLLSGHHYFTDPTSPVFNFDTSNDHLGILDAAKMNSSDAPSNAFPGPNHQGNGAVSWLYLAAKPDTTNPPYQGVYRLYTAGGSPPSNCTGQQAAFQIQYAATYWFFS